MKNSFSAGIREALLRSGLRELGISGKKKKRFESCCAAAFLRGAVLCAGVREQDRITLAPGHGELATLCGHMLSYYCKTEPALNSAGELVFPAGLETAVSKEKNCEECPKLFLRAAFLACGTVSDPAKAYQAVFRCRSGEAASAVSAALTRFSLHPGRSAGERRDLVYLRRGEEISDLLTAMGDPLHALQVQGFMAQRSVSSDKRRQSNCDIANIQKAVNGAQSAIAAIRFLASRGILNRLPDALRETARARLENPDLPLKDLCQLLPGSISKSGLNHRLQKLVEIAKDLKEEEKRT